LLCGRCFNSLRGLNIHRRSCFITDQVDLKDLVTPSEDIYPTTSSQVPIETNYVKLTKVRILPGVSLPKSDFEWNTANDYFKNHLNFNRDISDVNLTIRNFNETVYSYFLNTNGPVNKIDENAELKKKYSNFSKNKLKKVLKNLK